MGFCTRCLSIVSGLCIYGGTIHMTKLVSRLLQAESDPHFGFLAGCYLHFCFTHPNWIPFLSTPMPDPNLSRPAAIAINVVISRLQTSCHSVMIFVRNSVLLMSVHDISIVKKDIIMNRGGMHFCLYAKNRNLGVHFRIVDDAAEFTKRFVAY